MLYSKRSNTSIEAHQTGHIEDVKIRICPIWQPRLNVLHFHMLPLRALECQWSERQSQSIYMHLQIKKVADSWDEFHFHRDKPGITQELDSNYQDNTKSPLIRLAEQINSPTGKSWGISERPKSNVNLSWNKTTCVSDSYHVFSLPR